MKSQDLTAYHLPDAPGVYEFLAADGAPLYVGKATSLRDRVRSYFAADFSEARGPAIARMAAEAAELSWQETGSVLEALVLEAKTIRVKKPRYNVLGRDDKSFNHVVITREEFPRVLLVRGKELAEIRAGVSVRGLARRDIARDFGPFPQGGALREALRIVRRMFPFRDRCAPCSIISPSGAAPPADAFENTGVGVVRIERAARGTLRSGQKSCRPCFDREIGLCPGVCSGEISRKEYRVRVRRIALFFDGRVKDLARDLERAMRAAARALAFERAAAIKRELFALTHIRDVALLKRERWDGESGLRAGMRVEAYDVAHFAGGDTVGVMAVVADGEADKSEYRKFRIRVAARGSDTAALREVLARRLTHPEWPMPRLIAVDGGAAQKNAAEAALREHFGESVGSVDVPQIPVVGVVKDERHRPREIIGDRALARRHERDILLANSEAHRFAVRYHRALRARSSGGSSPPRTRRA